MHLSSASVYDFLSCGAALNRIFRRNLENSHIQTLNQTLIKQFAYNEQVNFTKYNITQAPLITLIEMLNQNQTLRDYANQLQQSFKLLIQQQIQKQLPIINAFHSDYELMVVLNALKVLLIISRLDSLESTSSFNLANFDAIEDDLMKKLQYNIRLANNIHNALTYMFYHYWENDCKKDYQLFSKKCGFLFGFRKEAEENNWPVCAQIIPTTSSNFDEFTEIFELQPELKGYIGDILTRLPLQLTNIDHHIFAKFTQTKRKNLALNGLAILAPTNECGLHLVKIAKGQYQLICPQKDRKEFIQQHMLPKQLYDLIANPQSRDRYQALLNYYPQLEGDKLYFDLLTDSYALEYHAIINNFFIRASELFKLKPQQTHTPFFNSLLSYNNMNHNDRIEVINLIAKATSISHLLAMRELWFKSANFLKFGSFNTSKHWTVKPDGTITRISERNSRINLLCAIKLFLLLTKENQLPNKIALDRLIIENPAFLFLKLARRTYFSDLSEETSSLYQRYCRYLDGPQSYQDRQTIIQYLNQRWHGHIEKINTKLNLEIDCPMTAATQTDLAHSQVNFCI
ncbi:hypothetical protein L3V82_02055 [Thiotrichales bacterium 19S3-7]|nr:hypothetical protein [Thiotrichales bacterium 19S3-7]MCF6800949.1 hypothetical protein [Thiotrichales bacterium 19S3-11]